MLRLRLPPGRLLPGEDCVCVAARDAPIAGSAQAFPVRGIYRIGRNYAAHARKRGSVVRGDVIGCHVDGLPDLCARIR